MKNVTTRDLPPLEEVKRFLDAYPEITRSRFGRMVMGDPRFYWKLEAGRQPRARTMAYIRVWMDEWCRAHPPLTGRALGKRRAQRAAREAQAGTV